MSLKKQATSGLVWTFSQQFGNQIIGFSVSLILARLLLPEEFGLIGMIAVFISVGQALVDSGLTQSIIRSKKLDQEDYSTVFYFNLAASCLIYVIIYLCAPFIAEFYGQQILTDITRLYCLVFIINAFSAVQQARLTRNLDFKTQTIISVPATIVSGIIGIILAYLGYGVWSLVWNQICVSLFSSIQFWVYSKWKPLFKFNIIKFKEHFKFGFNLTISSLLSKIFNNIYLIVIGRYFSPAQVGFYTRAETMKQLPVVNIANTLNKVTYPLFATIQEDNERLKRVYKQLMQMVVFIIAPTLIFLAVLGEPVFRFLFTAKWLPAVPYFQILCITGILYPIHAYNLNVLKVKGRSDLYLRLALIKKGITVIGIIVAINFGIYGLLWVQVILSLSFFVINAIYTNRFIDYSALEQAKDIFPIIFMATSVGLIVYFVDHLIIDQLDILRLLIAGSTGLSLYCLISYIFNVKAFQDIKKLIFKR